MSREKTERNKEIIEKKQQGWSFRRIGAHFNLDEKTVYAIYTRDKDKFGNVGSYPQPNA